MNKNRCWLLLILLINGLAPFVMAQNTDSLLPGSTSKFDRAISRADIIVVAKLVSLGLTVPDSVSQTDYNFAQIEVTKILKGSPGSNLTVSISVHYSKGRIEEFAPKEGKEYIFFIHTDEAKHLIVVKMLPATGSNVSAVLAGTTK